MIFDTLASLLEKLMKMPVLNFHLKYSKKKMYQYFPKIKKFQIPIQINSSEK